MGRDVPSKWIWGGCPMKKLLSTRMGGVVILTLAVATGLGFEVARVGAVTAPPANDYVHSLQYVSVTSASSKADTKTVTATCPAGKTATGGGADINRVGAGAYSIVTSKPLGATASSAPAGWTATATGVALKDWTVTVWAACADPNGQAPSTSTGDASSSGASSSGGSSSGASSGGSSSGASTG